jgi:hypothetical protein
MSRGPSAAQMLAGLAKLAILSHTADGKAFAHIPVHIAGQTHEEFWPVRSRQFKGWLRRAFFLAEGKPAPTQAMSETVDLIEAHALEAKQIEVHVRVAEHEGNIYVDLCDATWRVVEITAHGWTIVSRPPVAFRRAPGMLALPDPVSGVSLDSLRKFMNIDDDHAWRVLVHWLVMTLHPRGPFPVCALSGEQGSSKSTIATVLRNLVDPNSAPLRSEPREPRDLMIAANNGLIITLDNVSHLPPWLSDSLCRLATGGGFSTRELYSDEAEIIFAAKRPVLITGIEAVISRGDLMDRSVLIELPTIAPERRREESEFWSQFEDARPGLFGALLAAVAGGLRESPHVRLTSLPRMADFAKWSAAVERGLGSSGFAEAYETNIATAHEFVVESHPVAQVVRALAEEPVVVVWEGTVSDLLETLSNRVSETTKRSKTWPSSARALSGILRRLSPNLRAVGVDVTLLDHTRKGRLVRVGKRPSPPSPPSPDEKERALTRDGNSDGRRDGDGPDHHAAPTVTPTVTRKLSENNACDDRDDRDGRVTALTDDPTPSPKPPSTSAPCRDDVDDVAPILSGPDEDEV